MLTEKPILIPRLRAQEAGGEERKGRAKRAKGAQTGKMTMVCQDACTRLESPHSFECFHVE